MEIENHLIKNIKYIRSPNFNERSQNSSIKLITKVVFPVPGPP